MVGDLAAAEEIFALKLLMQSLGVVSLDCRQDGSKLDPKFGRASYIFNPTIAGIDDADAIMIIGSNPRKEAPVFNARIRKRWLKGNLLLGVIGENADLTYSYNHLGAGPESLARFIDHAPAQKERPLLLVGQGALARPDGAAILAQAAKAAVSLGCIKPGWTGFGVLHTAAARVGALDLGFVPGEGGLDALTMTQPGALDIIFNLGADEIDVRGGCLRHLSGHAWRPWRAPRRRRSAGRDPTPRSRAFTSIRKAACSLPRGLIFRPVMAREDWAILRALSAVLGKTLPFDSLHALRQKLFADYPLFAKIDAIVPGDPADIANIADGGVTPGDAAFVSPVEDSS